MTNIIKGITLTLPFALLSCGPVSSDVEQETEKRVSAACAEISRRGSYNYGRDIDDLKLLFALAKGGDAPSCVALSIVLPEMALFDSADEHYAIEQLSREWMLYALDEGDPRAILLCYRYPLTYGVYEAGYSMEKLRDQAEAAQEELRQKPSLLRSAIDNQSLKVTLP